MKAIAFFLRWCHLTYHLFDKKDHPPHLAFTVTEDTIFCGITIWTKTDKIACTCGKIWYDKL